MFNFVMSATARLGNILKQGAASRITDEQFIAMEIHRFKVSQRRKAMTMVNDIMQVNMTFFQGKEQ